MNAVSEYLNSAAALTMISGDGKLLPSGKITTPAGLPQIADQQMHR